MHKTAGDVIKAGLLKPALITDTSGEQLKPGMAFTIEPGIHIRQSRRS